MCPYHDSGGYDRQPDSRDGEPPARPPRLDAMPDGKPTRSGVQINIHPRIAGCGCFMPEIKIRYEIEGRKFELWTYDGDSTYFDRDSQQAIIDSFVVGEKYPCWYDPDRPDQAVLVRGHSWGAYVFLILPIGLLVLGAAGFVIAWKVASLPPRQVDGDRRALES